MDHTAQSLQCVLAYHEHKAEEALAAKEYKEWCTHTVYATNIRIAIRILNEE